MVCNVFENHGVFTGYYGGTSKLIPTGTVENIGLKNILKKDYPLNLGKVKEFKKGFRKKIENTIFNEGYEGGPWLVKHTAVYWPVWGEFNPKFILIKRDYHSVIRSNIESNMAGLKGIQLIDAYDENLKQMDIVRNKYGAPTVDSNEVVSGDFSSLERAFEYCGLDFEPEKAREVIKPEHWHY